MEAKSRFEPFYRAASSQVLRRIEAKLGPKDRLHEFIEYWIKRIKEYENYEMHGVEPAERNKIAESCLKYIASVLGQYRIKEAEMLYSVATAILEGKEIKTMPFPDSPQKALPQSGEQPEGAQEYSL